MKCVANPQSDPDANAADQELLKLIDDDKNNLMKQVDNLASTIKMLRNAVKLAELDAAAEKAADELNSIRGSKSWPALINTYCGKSTDRADFINQIKYSISLVKSSNDALTELLGKIGQ
jgi:SMC interacting uncharacterized protein involved in chromosome segregation